MFIKELRNYFLAALSTNLYFNPNISNWRLFLHSISHNLGSIAYFAFLRPFNSLGIFGCIIKYFRIFTFKSYTLIYLGSESFHTAF